MSQPRYAGQVQYDVLPGAGMGPIRLTMMRDDVRRVMAEPPLSFKKGTHWVDAYRLSTVQIFFADDEQHIEYIEISANEQILVLYRGVDVFTTPADTLIDLISQQGAFDPNDPQLGYSYIFPALELSLWRPGLPDQAGDDAYRCFITLGIGRVGYYSQRAPR